MPPTTPKNLNVKELKAQLFALGLPTGGPARRSSSKAELCARLEEALAAQEKVRPTPVHALSLCSA
jgi:hypothetical protein